MRDEPRGRHPVQVHGRIDMRVRSLPGAAHDFREEGDPMYVQVWSGKWHLLESVTGTHPAEPVGPWNRVAKPERKKILTQCGEHAFARRIENSITGSICDKCRPVIESRLPWRSFPPKESYKNRGHYFGRVGRLHPEVTCHKTPIHTKITVAQRCAERRAERMNQKRTT